MPSKSDQLPNSFSKFEAADRPPTNNLIPVNADEEIWILNAPNDFDFSKLPTVHFSKTNKNILLDNFDNKSYECDVVHEQKTVLAKNHENIMCKPVNKTFHIRQSMSSIKPVIDNCIARPEALKLTEGLKERQKLFGGVKYTPSSESIVCNLDKIEKPKKSKKHKMKRTDGEINIPLDETTPAKKKLKKSKHNHTFPNAIVKVEPEDNFHDTISPKRSKRSKKRKHSIA